MNVRWDAVVDQARVQKPGADSAARPSAAGSGEVELQIWLFGSLAPAGIERPLTLTVALPARLSDVMAQLGERFGPGFLGRVLDDQGAKHNHCRLFVDGIAVEDIATPLAESQRTQIEMILLTAAEGG